MDLGTTYMGLSLANPLVAGASPLSDDLDACRALEDHGVSALVMHSLFMEQIDREEGELLDHLHQHQDGHAEAGSFLPDPSTFALGPTEYLEQLARLKRALGIPVIASLNGTATGRWVRYATLMEEAGADGLELNVYALPLRGEEDARATERRHVEVLQAVKRHVTIPVSLKMIESFTSPVHFARQLAEAGADAVVLFAPLFHTDLDVERLEVVPSLHGSDRSALGHRLLWLSAMFGHVPVPLGLSGGAHTHLDVVKGIMSGATVVQMTSALLWNGPAHVRGVLEDLRTWLVEHEYHSLDQMRGSMSLQRCPDPEAFERANYIQVLQSWRPPR